MKYMLYITLLLLAAEYPVAAQLLEKATQLPSAEPYAIEVTDQATTVLVFPYRVLDATCGNAALHAEKVPSVDNLLKVKSSSYTMGTTSLHVYTSDGRVSAFKVQYTLFPSTYTYYSDGKSITTTPPNGITAASLNMDDQKIQTIVEVIKNSASFMQVGKKGYRMKLTLEGIYQRGDILFMRWSIRNTSALSFRAGLATMYIKDKKVARRSSAQQIAVTPVYTDSLPRVEGNASEHWVMAIPKTTIPDNKQLVFELQEKDGGRRIFTRITNRQLFKARKI